MIYSKLLKHDTDFKVIEGHKVLDIGCGEGKYLLRKCKNGVKCFGIDINGKALDRLREKNPEISIYHGNLWDAGYENNFFDFINLSDVMEHVFDFEALIIELKRILKPEGTIRIKVPNSESLTSKVFGKYWAGYDIPRHLYTFSKNNLKNFLSKMDMKIQRVRTMENSFYFMISFIYLINDKLKKKNKVSSMDKVWNNEILKTLFAPYAVLVNLLNAGDSVEFLIRKDEING